MFWGYLKKFGKRLGLDIGRKFWRLLRNVIIRRLGESAGLELLTFCMISKQREEKDGNRHIEAYQIWLRKL